VVRTFNIYNPNFGDYHFMKYFGLLFLLLVLVLFGCNNHAQKAVAPAVWLGKWDRNIHQNSAVLAIDSLRHDSIYFHLIAFSGGHNGDVEGWAKVAGSVASYFEIVDKDTCSITFQIYGDTLIQINQVKGNCFTAMGVYYDGKYINEKVAPSDNEQDYIDSFILLDDTAANKMLKKLVGSDFDLFVNSSQLSYPDTLDIDSLLANVHASGVRGLFTEMENVVMVDSAKNIWAAVIDDHKVYYYTTRKDWAARLPKTFDKWRANFLDYPITYKSK
jgi:hypothetical protein